VADLEVVSLRPLDPQRLPGAGNPLVVTVRNLSALAVPAFDVTFYAGDPMFATSASLPVLRTTRLNRLAAGR
jgi:hypothetical protein